MTVDRRLAGDAWEALFRAQVLLMRGFSASKIWGSLSTTEYDVLFTLSRGPAQGMRQADIADLQLIAQSSLSRLLDRLESKGLVERVEDPTDARCSLIRLTHVGRNQQREIGAAHLDDISRTLGDRLDHRELQQLFVLCSKLIGTANKSGSPT